MEKSYDKNECRKNIMEDLPEIALISDPDLREKVVDGWEFSLRQSSFSRISEIPGSGNPGVFVLKKGNQTDHLRGVTRMAIKLVEEFEDNFSDVEIDRDIVIAGALCHDIGKPWEFDPENLKRWNADPSDCGQPSLRHSVYGAHVCLTVGLPEKIAHIALGHSMEGVHIGISTECAIVRYADHTWWEVAAALGLLESDSLTIAPAFIRPRSRAKGVS